MRRPNTSWANPSRSRFMSVVGLAAWPARILFVLLLMVIPGSQILIYPILWILMPSEQAVVVRQPQTAPPAAA